MPLMQTCEGIIEDENGYIYVPIAHMKGAASNTMKQNIRLHSGVLGKILTKDL